MLQVLDYFRRLYKQENDTSFEMYPKGITTVMVPTWGYVCWLEQRLDKYEKEPLPEGKVTTTTYGDYSQLEFNLWGNW